MNIQSDRDYIESAERNDNINFDKKSDNNDMFNGIVEECKRKQNKSTLLSTFIIRDEVIL